MSSSKSGCKKHWVYGLAAAGGALLLKALYTYVKKGGCSSSSAKSAFAKSFQSPKLSKDDFKKPVNPEMKKVEFNASEFKSLLFSLMMHSKKLQNNPPSLVPQEELAANVVIDFLKSYTYPKGPLRVEKCVYKKGRANVIIEYNPQNYKNVVSFVGSHLDVVPANADDWAEDPFKLIVDGDVLKGRGVTDCLGHVALLTHFFRVLAASKVDLGIGVAAVFIANEEHSGEMGIGIDEMVRQHKLEFLKHAPLFWVDSANFGPTIGTGGMLQWEMKVSGKKFHSGLPNKAINPIELGGEIIRYIQDRFYKDFAQGDEEKKYLFEVGTSLKPTQVRCPPGGLNQIPQECTYSGDVRFTPFFTEKQIKSTIDKYLRELDVTKLPCKGWSRYELVSGDQCERGAVSWQWLGAACGGVAVDLESVGFKALVDAVSETTGTCKPFSLTGSLPIISDLKEAGFDVQVTGFGKLQAYHAVNEYGLLSDFEKGFNVCRYLVTTLDAVIGDGKKKSDGSDEKKTQ